MAEILIPGPYGRAEYIEKKSRFIGQVWRVESESEAQARIAATKEEYWDATHNVHAFILRSGASRCSDDGEPHGTAGVPVLEVFRKGGIGDVCCVVTRYFGGVLLGAGGLVRAYGKAAAMALEAAGICRMRTWTELVFECPYSFYEPALKRFENLGGAVAETTFTHCVTVSGMIPQGQEDALTRVLSELSSGKIEPIFTGEAELPERIDG